MVRKPEEFGYHFVLEDDDQLKLTLWDRTTGEELISEADVTDVSEKQLAQLPDDISDVIYFYLDNMRGDSIECVKNLTSNVAIVGLEFVFTFLNILGTVSIAKSENVNPITKSFVLTTSLFQSNFTFQDFYHRFPKVCKGILNRSELEESRKELKEMIEEVNNLYAE